MTSAERASRIWSVLVFAAREQKVVTYEMLSQMTGMANTMGRELEYILSYCKENDLPLLNLLAIQKSTGKPAPDSGVSQQLLDDLPAQQARVFVYDWLNHGASGFDAFLEARANKQRGAAAVV